MPLEAADNCVKCEANTLHTIVIDRAHITVKCNQCGTINQGLILWESRDRLPDNLRMDPPELKPFEQVHKDKHPESTDSILLAGDTCGICGKLLSASDDWKIDTNLETGEREPHHVSCKSATN